VRQELAVRFDFNLQDLYTLFDVYSKQYLTTEDISAGLRQFQIHAAPGDVDLLTKHYGGGIQQLNFVNFSRLFLSTEQGYGDMVRQRRPTGRSQFTPATETNLRRVLRLHLTNEANMESLRQRLNGNPNFNAHDAFDILDNDGNNMITRDEFNRLLSMHGINASKKELDVLVGKFDHNRDGRVSYNDFAQEVRPHSPSKY
jgi:hypothetical protein